MWEKSKCFFVCFFKIVLLFPELQGDGDKRCVKSGSQGIHELSRITDIYIVFFKMTRYLVLLFICAKLARAFNLKHLQICCT